MKAGGTDVTILENRSVFIFCAKAMCRIIDDFQRMPVCNFLYCINITWITIDMSRKYGGSFWCYRLLYFFGIYIKSLRDQYQQTQVLQPSQTILFVVATNENGVVIISPVNPKALIAICSAIVPFET